MHRAAFLAAGLPGHYEARDILPADLASALAELRRGDVLGANLSLPHKEAALPLLDELTEAARAIGAVNTVIQRGGQLHGDNTDAPGLLLALRDAGADLRPGQSVAVLGAGGAARAAVWALLRGGLTVYVVNRTLERAQKLCRELSAQARQRSEVPWAEISTLMNASSAGLSDPASTPLPDFDFGTLPPGALVYDMVYRPAQTRLMTQAVAAGLRAENGLSMLAQQARLSFLAWTGHNLPVSVFLEAAREQF